MLGLRKVIKRKELEEEEGGRSEEGIITEDEMDEGVTGEDLKEAGVKEEVDQQEGDLTEKLVERINEIENRLPRIDISINGLRRDMDALREEIRKIDESMGDIMALYEVVSAQINPFVGSSKVTSLSVERINALERAVDEIENEIRSIKLDLRLILRDSLNIKGIVEETIYGESP